MYTLDEAKKCIDDLLYYEIKAGEALKFFSTAKHSDDSAANPAFSQIAIDYAAAQHITLKEHFIKLYSWSNTDSPNIYDYGMAKKGLHKKKLHNIFACATVATAGIGLAGYLIGDIPLLIAGIALPTINYFLAVSQNPRAKDDAAMQELERYNHDRITYSISTDFKPSDEARMLKFMESYIPALENMMDKLEPRYSTNGVLSDQLSAVQNTYITLKLFQKNAPEIFSAIRERKASLRNNTIKEPKHENTTSSEYLMPDKKNAAYDSTIPVK